MHTTVPDKLLKVAADVKAHGSASLTRLTVLKKWFESSHRLAAFAIFIAQRACEHEDKIEPAAVELFHRSRVLLIGGGSLPPRSVAKRC